MALKSFKPYTKSRRYLTVLDKAEVTKDQPAVREMLVKVREVAAKH